jgi:superfamily II RNA helicase
LPDEDSSTTSYYERRLQQEIEAIELKLKELTAERDALRRQLIKARWENHHLRDVSRKNSASRVLVEQRVLAALEQTTKPMTSRQLFSVARLANFELKENTFRTHLHRMKSKGLIENVSRGRWRGIAPAD